MTDEEGRSSRKTDFDFLMGTWRVQHRRLKSRLSECTEWIESDGTSVVRPMMGGLANVDDNLIEGPSGTYCACSFRTFDPAKGQWSIWWFDGRSPGRPVDPPVVGRFEHGVGTFYSDETLEGQPIRVRYVWSQTETDAPRWEQAFSVDRGATWETNWTMQFTRVKPGEAPAED
jgi:hypothetical protein